MLKYKDEALKYFKQWKPLMENQTRKKVKWLRTDNGLEFYNSQFDEFCKDEGIGCHRITPYSSQQNGVVERMNQTLVERAQCMLLNVGLSKSFWAKAMSTAYYLVNQSLALSINFQTPEEVWSGTPIDYSKLIFFDVLHMLIVMMEN